MPQKLTIETMHEQFVSPYVHMKAEDMYKRWQQLLPFKLPSFEDFDNQLNNEAMTTESFREFFTEVDSDNIAVPEKFLVDRRKPTRVCVCYRYQVDGEIFIDSVFTGSSSSMHNLIVNEEFTSHLKSSIYAIQSKM